MVSWFNSNAGFATVLVTAVLVLITAWYACATWRLERRSRDHLELDRRTRRGANIVVRFRERTIFDLWTKGPSDAVNLRLRLEVDGWQGPELKIALAQNRLEPHSFNYQVFVDDHAVPSRLADRVGKLVGDCENQYGEPEPVGSGPFRVRLPSEAQGNLVTYERA